MLKRVILSFISSLLLFTILPSISEASQKDKLVDFAKNYIGVPYKFGGTSPSGGFDCSGYLRFVFNHINVSLPRTTIEQYKVGEAVAKPNLEVGDIVFFETYRKGPSHSGIYIGNNEFIHASSSRGIMISSVNDPYYFGPRYLGARRVLKEEVVVEKETAPIPEKVVAPLQPGQFHDVPKDYWAYSQITALSEAGVLNGNSDSFFKPDESITRAQAAVILVNALDLPSPSSNMVGFNDVSSDHWAAKAIAATVNRRIFVGDEKGNFRPNDLLTRAQSAIILANALTLDLVKETSGSLTFTDVPKTHWAYAHIEALAQHGIVSGSDRTSFSPELTTTRAHFAVMIYNSLK